MKKAFTLVELLTVLAILVVLAGITLPVLAQSKRAAYATKTISNLRQAGVALNLYLESEGDYPNRRDSTEFALKGVDLCNPLDQWSEGCKYKLADPMVGSFGYVRLTEPYRDEENWRSSRIPPAWKGSRALLADIHFADPYPKFFAGDCPHPFTGHYFPMKSYAMREDTSVSVEIGRNKRTTGNLWDWVTFFEHLDFRNELPAGYTYGYWSCFDDKP